MPSFHLKTMLHYPFLSGFKSVAYLTGHQIGGATHKWNYMFSASSTSTELDANDQIQLLVGVFLWSLV
jgi:hypothetical protein